MTGWLSIMIEMLVSILLMVTIGYCLIVSRKLERLKGDQAELRVIVRELTQATDQAEAAIGRLKSTVTHAEESLCDTIDAAAGMDQRLAQGARTAQAVLDRFAVLSRAQGAPSPALQQQAALASAYQTPPAHTQPKPQATRDPVSVIVEAPLAPAAQPRPAATAAQRPAAPAVPAKAPAGFGLLSRRDRAAPPATRRGAA